eukprot:Sspe_Gene.96198::Locus_68706_Transcript_1_1_Confidence_1.000_Length_1426::g.96198::m.96198
MRPSFQRARRVSRESLQVEVRELDGVLYLGYGLSDVESLHAVAIRASKFQCMDIKGPSGKVFNAGSFDTRRSFPPRKRLAAVFLQLLGRTDDRTQYVEGVPHVSLANGLAGEGTVRLSGEVVDKQSAELKRQLDVPQPGPGLSSGSFSLRKDDGGSSASGEEIYGAGEWDCPMDEVRRLEKTTRVTLSSDIPPRFYAAMCELTTDTRHCEFFSVLRSIPLSRLCEPNWDKVLVCERERQAQAKLEMDRLLPKLKGSFSNDPMRTELMWDYYVAECTYHNSSRNIHLLRSPEQYTPTMEAWRATVRQAMNDPHSFGFRSKEHALSILGRAMTELCTGVCVSQEGYFFVDGTDGLANQLCQRTPDPVVFLSAPGLDFCTDSTTRLEMPKYFEESGRLDADLKSKWSGFVEGGQERLKARVKVLYTVIFSAAAEHGVRNPSMLPMGLGVF